MDEKKKFFSRMKSVNPDFIIREDVSRRPQDVKMMKTATKNSPGVELAKQRIDSPNEFGPAFEVWFNGLGFDPIENPIAKSKVRYEIENILTKLGYK
jgi:hypothetical protein